MIEEWRKPRKKKKARFIEKGEGKWGKYGPNYLARYMSLV
jgi:hypothetical protein